ncbi:MAG TPA: sugar phosphate nucleotidyltransferase [Azospirillaceae bacterium]|nr:sugar phosphate nucleotidyltransferase [Azospirillaceae bacterium]
MGNEVEEAVILAGGLGTRLRSAVPDLPKPLAPVRGRPFLDYLLDYLAAQGIRRAILSVGYRREAIVERFGTSYGGLEIDYAVEEEPLGTGGGLRLGLERVRGPAAFALNGDTFLGLPYGQLAAALDAAGGAPFAVALRPVEDAERFGRVMVEDGRMSGFAAAGGAGPGLINAGVYLLPRDLFDRHPVPARFSFEKDFLEARAAELRPATLVADGPFIDIGVPESFALAQEVLEDMVYGGRPR